MSIKRLITGAAGALLAAGLLGCNVGGPDQTSETSLLDVQIPEDFTFATTKGLTLTALGDPVALRETLAEIRLASGELVHKGALAVPVELAIPRATQSLQVTLRSNTNESVVLVPVVDGRAVINVD